MDPKRFDALAIAAGAASSRRGVLRTAGVGAIASLLAEVHRVEEAGAACQSDGAKCRRATECCSGACEGKKKKRKCRAAPGALGCTIDDPYDTRCPGSTDPDHFCWITLAGKPLCGRAVRCFACASNADCVSETGNASAKCVAVPPAGGCEAFNRRGCIVFP